MKTLQILKHGVLIAGILMIIIAGCNQPEKQTGAEPQSPPVNQVVCPKGLAYSDCPNPQAMHGQVMVHNMTERTYEVKLEHHDSASETKQIAPGDGWTFTSVLQGKRLITAKPSTGGYGFESSCTVIGNTQHMMNIMPNGIMMIDAKEHAGH